MNEIKTVSNRCDVKKKNDLSVLNVEQLKTHMWSDEKKN